MRDVYIDCPIFENDDYKLKLIALEDCDDLLKVYNNEKSLPLFNSDNCNGDDFHYYTFEMMINAINFWIYSYNNRWFVRWSIFDKLAKEVIGTIELFHRDSTDAFNNCGLLRFDLRYDYENTTSITSILNLIVGPTYDLFNCDVIATKGFDHSQERIIALAKLGFVKSDFPLMAKGVQYNNYWVRNK